MPKKIPETLIEEIRSSVNIADVIGQYVQLKKSGKNLFGLCPFHEERTPSFSVNEDKQIFHCFSCGRGGNVFKFLMELNDLSFPEAVIQVAKDANIEIPNQYLQQGNEKPVDPYINNLISAHEIAAQLYHHILLNTESGENALEYAHQRGLNDEIIKEFNLGYAPDEDILLNYLSQKDFKQDLLRDSGLFVVDRNGNFHDRFKGRLMFPINDISGQTIAFSGRLVQQRNDLPKYLNSPESKIFHKSTTLFNLNLAKTEINKQKAVILFEGFMDVIAAYSAGVSNAVASMGTSLTEEQLRILQRMAKKIYISYDGDSAGQKATNRAISLIQHVRGLQIGVVQMPDQLDPDEYLRKFCGEKFKQIYDGPKETVIDFELRYLKNKRNLNQHEDQIAYINDALKLIATLSSSVEQNLYLNQIAKEFSLNKDELNVQLQKMKQNQHNQYRSGKKYINKQRQENNLSSFNQAIKLSRLERAERFLLQRMLTNNEVWLKVTSQKDFHFIHDDYQTLYLLAQSYKTDHSDFQINAFLDYLDSDDLQQTLVEIIDQINYDDNQDLTDIDDYLKLIQNEAPLDERIQQKQKQMEEAKRLNDAELQSKIMKDLIGLYKQKQALKHE